MEIFPAFLREVGKVVFRWPDLFTQALLYESLALAAQGIVGVLFLRLFFRLPLLLELISSVFVGMGLVTFPCVILAIFFWLNPATVLATVVGLCLFFLFLKKVYGWSAVEFDFEDDEKSIYTANQLVYGLAVLCLTAITLLSFYHGLLYPVTYWDSLIYYVHYGKLTYEQGGFPILYCLQVGLGLGANYPHLFGLHQALTATVFGQWSDVYAQFLTPFAGLSCTVVLYYLCQYLCHNKLASILAVLAFRSISYVTSYLIWTTDYSLVMVYTVLLLLFLAFFIQRESLRMLFPVFCVGAIFPHINYLGWIVWPCIALAVLWWWIPHRQSAASLSWVSLSMMLWVGIALIWYVRNTLVTGNPVYAFFPEILGGKNINLDVLRSCEEEWFKHGVGAARLGSTLLEKLLNTPWYLVSDWRFAPVTAGICLPSVLFGWHTHRKFFTLAGLLGLLYIGYQYCISGFYWYHIIALFPILGVFTARFLSGLPGRWLLLTAGVLILAAGVNPGVSYSLMGSKLASTHLPLFAHPGVSPSFFYQYVYPDVSAAWHYINTKVEKNSLVLSHDNRYHVFRDDIQIIHLDDCGLTPLYGKPYRLVHEKLLERGIRYYLYIPDEDTHPITRQLGHQDSVDDPRYFQKVFEKPVSYADGCESWAVLYRLMEP